ncbi:hypothetical protein B0H15DRAFT_847366 [Mycena belliarum]|uniref:DUF6533 domain-containing protein n=1 Tax=Mycena belliarum TaxID=1033014 RepID=A0AAD6TZV0_9AGAR|nr:hypothetical protein B0H15DRAFT_847366 [Mycena belliae]
MAETFDDPDIQSALVIFRFLVVIPYTILLYDYLLTLEREVTRFWGRRFTWASGFFFLNRYFSLFGTIPILVQHYSTTTDPAKMPMCRAFRAYHQYFALSSQVLVANILIIRTYALYERSKVVLGLMLLVMLGAFVFAMRMLLTGTEIEALPPHIAAFGCPIGTPHAKSLRLGAAWSSLLVFDVMIFGLTLFKALRYGRDRTHGGLVSVLLRDGSLYFALISISNAANIATYIRADPLLSGSATTVTNVVASLMISRLMFNLGDSTRSVGSWTLTTRRLPPLSTLSPYTTESEEQYVLDTRWTTDAGAERERERD